MSRTTAIRAALSLMLVAVWVWLWSDYRHHCAEHVAARERLGSAILGAAVGAIYQSCRGGRYDGDELVETLDGVRTQVGSTWLGIADAGAGAGAGSRYLAEAGIRDAADPGELFRRELEPPKPRGPGRGLGRGARWSEAEGLVAFPDTRLELRLEHPRTELDQQLAGDRQRFLLTGAAMSFALVSVILLLWSRMRSVELGGRLEASHEKVKALEFLRRLGAGLGHETKNPLGVVRGHAERLCAGAGTLDPAEVKKSARAILDETDRTVARLDEFINLSRPSELRRTRVELCSFLEELVGLLAPDLEQKGASAAVVGEAVEVPADREQARRLFMNLLLNGVQALSTGGRIEVRIEDLPGLRRVRIEDDGEGVPEAIRGSLFEPYVTGGKAGGAGLGLAIAQRIATDHGWRLYHRPAGGGPGTVMTIDMPET